ncbi:DUF6783 domain-containing protein [Ruminococcus sp. 5_1_39BFAA]
MSLTNCDAHLAESIFQARSKLFKEQNCQPFRYACISSKRSFITSMPC